MLEHYLLWDVTDDYILYTPNDKIECSVEFQKTVSSRVDFIGRILSCYYSKSCMMFMTMYSMWPLVLYHSETQCLPSLLHWWWCNTLKLFIWDQSDISCQTEAHFENEWKQNYVYSLACSLFKTCLSYMSSQFDFLTSLSSWSGWTAHMLKPYKLHFTVVRSSIRG